MISISQIESLSHGLDYYTKDNYYSKDDQKEFTQWYGKAAKNLGLKGEVSFSAFQKALIGVSISGKIGIQTAKKETSDAISVDKIAEFKSDTSTYIQSLNIDNESKIKIHEILDQISNSNTKIQKTRLEKHQNKIFSVINKQTELSIEEKISIKNNIKSKTEVFKKTASRRSGYDLTFSAPKSVSLQALVHGDKAILEAHRESVKCALAIVEKEYSQIRIREKGKSDRKIEVTGNIAAAMFEHDVSRKTDPQLHTHCVLMNFTKKSDGSWRSINQDGFYYNSKQIGSIYQNELAKRVQALGYDIKLNGNGTFDIKGYSDVQLLQFSKRTEQLRALGAQTQKQATKLIKKNRDKKDESISRESLLEKWKEEAIAVGINQPLPQMVLKTQINRENRAGFGLTEIIENSVKELTDRDVSFKKSALISSILGKALGKYEYHDVVKEIDRHLKSHTHEIGSKNVVEYIPLHILKLETDSISMMQNGKNNFDGILSKAKATDLIDAIHQKSKETGHMGLNKGQREAIDLMLTSEDRIFAWQGVAGAGKSFSLGAASKIAMDNGIIVKGFAPSAEAAKNLAAEAKLNEAHTVASLLVKDTQADRAKGNEIWIVDEAGLLSARDAHDLLKKAEIENARVLLVGDTRQLSAVGAGNPFKQLQKNGIVTAQLNQGIRQKDETMKKSVDLIADGRHKDGLCVLDNAGKIFEVQTTEDIISKMAKDYLDLSKEDAKKSLFISSTNYEKEEITNLVRVGLKSRGDLEKTSETVAYVSHDFNEHALKYANVYSAGDVIILNKAADGLEANKPYKILEVNPRKNCVSIQLSDQVIEISVSKIKCNLFREEKIEMCVGDKLKWTKNHQDKKDGHDKKQKTQSVDRRLNGQNITVKDIDLKSNKALLEYDNGKQESIDLSKKHFLNYNYVTTVFSSQGKTCDKVYASLTAIDRENFYVAISRAKYDCKIYSKDKEILYRNVEKIGSNKTAFDKILEKSEQLFNSNILKTNFANHLPKIDLSSIPMSSISNQDRKKIVFKR